MVADSKAMAPPPPAAAAERDLRLDLFRGVALWLIFLDHIPENIVSWLTIRNYGFSDATEIFIFISG
ncbi:MAG TPA: OpgC domain-containing protein, partial [Xanthobacteraceae bacterium]|nr:OpgC domain-containing protein [Xanthobacteraceae bacterium]